MKVFWVLEWEDYYPQGGLDNVVAQFETYEEARLYIKEKYSNRSYMPDHLEVVDVSRMLGLGKNS